MDTKPALWVVRSTGFLGHGVPHSLLARLLVVGMANGEMVRHIQISILRQSRRFYDCWPLKGA